MKKTIYILSALLGMVTVTEAQTAIDLRKQDIVDGVSVENLKIERNGGYIAIDMLWDLSGLDIIGKTKIPSDFPDISKDNLEK